MVSQVPQIHDKGGIALFADDTKVYNTNADILQNELYSLEQWFDTRQLVLAPHKCFHLQISKPKLNSVSSSFKICNVQVTNTDQMKDLGVIVSENLKWAPHISKIYRESSFISYQIRKSFHTKNIWTLLNLYKTYIRPKLEYNCPIWSPGYIKDKKLIESIQRDFTRFACRRSGIKFNSYNHRLQLLNLKSLEYRRIEFDLLFLYKIVYGLCFLNFSDYFIFKHCPYSLRRNSLQIQPLATFSNRVWDHCFFNRVPKVWNQLPDEVVTSKDLQMFRFKLKQFDLTHIVKTEHD